MANYIIEGGHGELSCPHCGADNGDTSDLGLDGDGEAETVTCESCGEEYIVSSWTTYRIVKKSK